MEKKAETLVKKVEDLFDCYTRLQRCNNKLFLGFLVGVIILDFTGKVIVRHAEKRKALKATEE